MHDVTSGFVMLPLSGLLSYCGALALAHAVSPYVGGCLIWPHLSLSPEGHACPGLEVLKDTTTCQSSHVLKHGLPLPGDDRDGIFMGRCYSGRSLQDTSLRKLSSTHFTGSSHSSVFSMNLAPNTVHQII